MPHYLAFSRYSDRLRFFQLIDGQYQEQRLDQENPRAWLSLLDIGLEIWQGEFDGITRSWLRWYDAEGNGLPTDTEEIQQRLDQERFAKEVARSQLLQGARNLLATGMSVEQVAQILGLSEAEIRSL